MIDADGGSGTFLTPGSDPVWSPDGAQLAFMVEGEDGATGVYVIDAAGGNGTFFTPGSDPGWSPDGAQIAFTSDEEGTAGVYLIDSAGGSGDFPHCWVGTDLVSRRHSTRLHPGIASTRLGWPREQAETLNRPSRTETLKRMVKINGVTWTFLVVVYGATRTINKDLRLPRFDRLIRKSRIIVVFLEWVPAKSRCSSGTHGHGSPMEGRSGLNLERGRNQLSETCFALGCQLGATCLKSGPARVGGPKPSLSSLAL